MASTITINRAGVFCAACNKELPIGTSAKLYHSKEGRKYYGLDGCHEKKKMTKEEFVAMKQKQQTFLIQKDDKELDDLMMRINLTGRDDMIQILQDDDTGEISPEDKETLRRVKEAVANCKNTRIGAYAWPRLREQATTKPVEDESNLGEG